MAAAKNQTPFLDAIPAWIPETIPEGTAGVIVIRRRADDTLEVSAIGVHSQSEFVWMTSCATVDVVATSPLQGHSVHWDCGCPQLPPAAEPAPFDI